MTEFCTSVAIMERGRLVAAGSIDALRRQVMGAMTLVIEVIGPAEPLEQALSHDPHVLDVSRRDGHVSVRFGGEREAAAELLARLVAEGVRVSSFARTKEGLEELFIKIGARELA
jgi:ABC-2 type transport system ATP-binding protein